MSSQSVSLVWDDHHKTLVSVFQKLLVNSHFVDCVIAAEGQKMKAHKEVLSAFSPLFELLFREETENNPTVIISGISFKDLKYLVDFMYQGKLEVTEDGIQDLIDAAECLQIEGLGGGHKEDDSEDINNTTVLPKRPTLPQGIPNERARKAENEQVTRVFSTENEINNINFSNVPIENSVLSMCVARQTSPVKKLMANSHVQNVSDISLMPVQSSLSEIEIDSLRLQGEYVVKKEPDSDGDENIDETMSVCGSSGNSYENSGEPVHGLSADINVPSEKNVYEDLPLDFVFPPVPSSELCIKNLTGPSVRNELGNINVNLSSDSVNPVEPAVETEVPYFHSDFHIKTEDETPLSMDNDLKCDYDEFSENMPKSIEVPSVSDMRMKIICTEKKIHCSGAASGCISETTYSPQELPAAFVKIQSIGRNEPAVGVMPGLPGGVNPQDTHPSHVTPVCDRDLSDPFRRSDGNGSISTDVQYSCQMCGKTFTRNRQLSNHMRIHTENRLNQNDECNYGGVTSIMLNKHQRIGRGQKMFECSECGYKSTRSDHVKVHKRIHSGVRPYKCTECDYAASESNTLRRHQVIHSGVKPYKCAECNYRSGRLSDLKTHQRIHSRVKPYKCAECDYRSGRLSVLKTHQLIHNGVKPYKCAECNYRSGRLSDLKTHQRIHSGVKPYKCAECDYSTNQPSNLTRHQRIHSRVKSYVCRM